MKQLGLDYADCWKRGSRPRTRWPYKPVFEGPAPLAGLRGSAIYLAETRTAAATATYELEVRPAEAVGLMAIVEGYVLTVKYGTMSRLMRPSLRGRAQDHESMLKAVSPQVDHLRQQPIIGAFMDRMSHHLAKDMERRP